MSNAKPADQQSRAAAWIGQRVGSHRLLRLLGEGGMGTVFEGAHDGTAGRAAVKILRSDVASRPEVVARFFNEARAANAIDHPGIVRIHDSGFTESGVAYLTMEFLEGESLRTRLDRVQRLPALDALRLTRQLASALVAAHRKNVIHRDLKPDNIMLVPDPDLPSGERVKILDFGIAKIAEGLSATPMHTRTDMVMGTPTYMAPEQCRGAKSVTERLDVYALGVILYQMLAGRPPFVGDSVGELIAMHLMDPPPPLREYVPGIEPAVVALVDRMLLKKPDQRPAMEGVFQELQHLELLPAAPVPSQSGELNPIPTVVYSTVPRPEPLTAPLKQVGQLEGGARQRTATPQAALPALPVLLTSSAAATAVRPALAPPVVQPASAPLPALQQPVIRQPGPGMRTVSVAASEWVQPGVPKSRRWRTGALTLGVFGGVVIGTLALLRLATPDAPATVALRIPKRDAVHAAASPVKGAHTALDTAGTSGTPDNLPSAPETVPDPEPEEKILDPRIVAASAAYKAELYDKAIKASEPLVRSFPLRARWIIGMAACKQQNTALADKILGELADLGRPHADASAAEITLTCQHEKELREVNLRNPFAPIGNAEQYYQQKQYKLARTAAEQITQQEPVKSWELIGRASCALQDPVKASEALAHLEQNLAFASASIEALKIACESFGVSLRSGRKHK